MPLRADRPFRGLLILAVLLCGLGYFIVTASNQARCIAAVLAGAFCAWIAVENRRERNRFAALASTRINETICDFARHFDTRQTDTWIIRAAYEEIQRLLDASYPRFPVRASDSLAGDLGLDPDGDVDDLLRVIAERAGYSLAETGSNPHFGKVRTVADLVLFANAQPRLGARDG